MAVRIVRRLREPHLREVLVSTLQQLNGGGKSTFTYHERPKIVDYRQTDSNYGDWGILVQGPPLGTDDFTVNSIRNYSQLFPGAVILVSCWEGLDPAEQKKLETAGAKVLLNPLPEDSGPFNINYQIASTKAGLDHLSRLGLKYAIKARSDQRFHNPETINQLKALLTAFPTESTKISERIIACSFTSLKYRPFSISDMFQAGVINDLIMFWDAPYDHRSKEDFKFKTVQEFTECQIAEVYLTVNFCTRIGYDNELTLTNYQRALKELFCIIDAESIDLYWPKYKGLKEYQHRYYNGAHTYDLLLFNDWLAITQGQVELSNWDEDISNTEEGGYFNE